MTLLSVALVDTEWVIVIFVMIGVGQWIEWNTMCSLCNQKVIL